MAAGRRDRGRVIRRRLDELSQAIRDEAWYARIPAGAPDAEREVDWARLTADLGRVVDEEIDRLSAFLAAGTERTGT